MLWVVLFENGIFLRGLYTVSSTYSTQCIQRAAKMLSYSCSTMRSNFQSILQKTKKSTRSVDRDCNANRLGKVLQWYMLGLNPPPGFAGEWKELKNLQKPQGIMSDMQVYP